MLSVILYGRNDGYGYNLHKRAALSINCISEVLTDPGDELLFVDYNSPDDYPTFPEAIEDTLTERAKQRLRVFRVRQRMHERVRGDSHLNALEPIARNVAIRRSNPANRWVLSTNTDMIFVPHQGQSLSQLVRDLPRGLYHLPRFEIPESLWESFNRYEPGGVIDQVQSLSRIAHLNDIVEVDDVIRFDAPGDFQLIERDDLFKISGFHEGMLLGWHVDSNIAKRLFLLYGETRDLTDKLFGYHCDHTRQVTPAHRKDSASNDFDVFVSDVTSPYVPEQADSWGLPDTEIEEVRLGQATARGYVEAIRSSIPRPQAAPTVSSIAPAVYDKVSYSAAHVLPFLVDLFVSAPPGFRIGWVGSNPELFAMFRTFWESMGRVVDIQVFEPESGVLGRKLEGSHVESVEALSDRVDALIFDYNAAAAGSDDGQAQKLLADIRSTFISLAALENERLRSGHAPRRFVAVNAFHNAFEQTTTNLLNAAKTPFNARIRQGFVVKLDAKGTAWAESVRVGDAGRRQNQSVCSIGGKQGIVLHGPCCSVNQGDGLVSIELACRRIIQPYRFVDAVKGLARVKVFVDGTVVA
ncbi:hypothetical protein, partial [Planktothrix sp.]|uniref:hypothetical protein n=1 Tax=Planktothrix sp. TaxID=3088171 RepID=UPI0038D47CCC